MTTLFGVDIAAAIGAATAGQLLPATLTRVTPGARTPGSLTAGTNPTTQTRTCEGIIEDYDDGQIDGTLVQDGDRRVLLIAASIQEGAIPEPGDQITIEGQTLTVVRVRRDPAAASYTCQVRA
jgi:hypothetical protein